MTHDLTLLNEIDAFIEKKGLTPTSFGLRAIGDPHLIPDMRKGRDLRQSTVNKIRQFIGAV